MRKHALTVSMMALTLALPAAAMADNHGRGRGHDARAEDGGGRGPDRGRSDDRGGREDRGRGGDDRGRGRERAQVEVRAAAQADRGPGRGQERGRGGDDRSGSLIQDLARDAQRGQQRGPDRDDDRRVVVVRDERSNRDFRDALRDLERRDDRERREAIRDFERRLEGRDLRVLRDRDRDYVVLVRDPQYRVIEGCPPGLAWRNNGCLPPGQARRLERRAYYDWIWDRRDDDYRYRYADGYVYRTNQSGGLSGWLPVLAGALGLNNVWPQQYSYEPVPQYYNSYYGLGDRYDYRYADGVVYALDPRTNRIQQVSALMTGQPWTIGQSMPKGYDVYNVPYQYRTQYRDTPDRWYRYNDGYVYQVDPTTQLVQAVIQLLT